MQGIDGIRDKIRADVEDLDGGYTTIAKAMRKSTSFIYKTLSQKNNPRITTLEKIKSALDTARGEQQSRLEKLSV